METPRRTQIGAERPVCGAVGAELLTGGVFPPDQEVAEQAWSKASPSKVVPL